MKKRIFALLLTACLAACSSASKLTEVDGASDKAVSARFVEENGPLMLTFDSRGNWLAIETSATAPVSNGAAEGREVAFKIATMRAKRNLVEFLSNDVKSTKSIQTVSKTYIKHLRQTDNASAVGVESGEDSESTNAQGSQELQQKANKLAMIVNERIEDNAQQIIKGVFVVNRKFSEDGVHVSVTIRVTQSSIKNADMVRHQMGN